MATKTHPFPGSLATNNPPHDRYLSLDVPGLQQAVETVLNYPRWHVHNGLTVRVKRLRESILRYAIGKRLYPGVPRAKWVIRQRRLVTALLCPGCGLSLTPLGRLRIKALWAEGYRLKGLPVPPEYQDDATFPVHPPTAGTRKPRTKRST